MILDKTTAEALINALPTMSQAEQLATLEILEELEKRAHAQKCRDDLIAFCMYMDPEFLCATHHRKLANLLMDITYNKKDRIAVSIPPRHGKLCADSTPVLTPTGWTTHGELKVGDYVFGPDGKPTRILAVSEKDIANVQFMFSNGDAIKVHKNHEWTLFYKPNKQWKTLESSEFSQPMKDPRGQGRMRKIWSGERGARGSKALYGLPKLHAVEFPNRTLPLDPYLLGVWLGDGTAGKTTVTMTAEDMAFIAPVFEQHGYSETARHTHTVSGIPTVSFAASDETGYHKLSRLKSALIAAGTYTDKCISKQYKFSSIEQRLKLLAGLIDTDGHVELESKRVRIVTSSSRLAEDIKEVATSLGFAPYITEQEPTLSTSGIQGRQVVYTVAFVPNLPIPTLLPRKAIDGVVKRECDPSLVDVVAVNNPEPGHCIQVDRVDGLYLVGRNLTPTHNSHLISTLFPAWFLGKFPTKKVMMVSNTTDLAVDFGRKVRNIIADEKYASIFPGISLAADSKSAGRWSTNHNGEYFATGVGAAIAGRGADLLLVDDPHKEGDLLNGNFDALEKTYQWFLFGARTRLMSGGRVAIVHTRWHQDDLIGHLVTDGTKNPKADQYEVFEFPAILPSGKALWPEKFDLTALERTKASMPTFQWNAQYMQAPTAEGGALIKREWWRVWKKDKPPTCDYVIMALDAAAEKNQRADFTAILTFGVFSDDELTDGASHLILLNAINVRVEFPELKDLALREYKDWEPDSFIVEKKSAGTQLYQELRRIGVPVTEFTPGRNTGDKVARVNAIADILRSGMVWYPEGRRWAEEVIEQCVAFPFGSHDDLVDTLSMSLSRFRQGGFIALPTDFKDQDSAPRRAAYY